MSGPAERPAAEYREDAAQREAATVAEMTAPRSPHSVEMDRLSIAAPPGGYGGEQGAGGS